MSQQPDNSHLQPTGSSTGADTPSKWLSLSPGAGLWGGSFSLTPGTSTARPSGYEANIFDWSFRQPDPPAEAGAFKRIFSDALIHEEPHSKRPKVTTADSYSHSSTASSHRDPVTMSPFQNSAAETLTPQTSAAPTPEDRPYIKLPDPKSIPSVLLPAPSTSSLRPVPARIADPPPLPPPAVVAPLPTKGRGRGKKAQSDSQPSPQPKKAPKKSTAKSKKVQEEVHDDGEDSETRRKSFLERNRQAACKSRQKKKEMVTTLQQKCDSLSIQNQSLQIVSDGLRQELADLRKEAERHRGCGNSRMDQYLASHNSDSSEIIPAPTTIFPREGLPPVPEMTVSPEEVQASPPDPAAAPAPPPAKKFNYTVEQPKDFPALKFDGNLFHIRNLPKLTNTMPPPSHQVSPRRKSAFIPSESQYPWSAVDPPASETIPHLPFQRSTSAPPTPAASDYKPPSSHQAADLFSSYFDFPASSSGWRNTPGGDIIVPTPKWGILTPNTAAALTDML